VSCATQPARRDACAGVASVLLLLIEQRDRVVSKDELLEALWHGMVSRGPL
jgi:DNA-binding winged helix-turn-helix (wHTH) protein